MDSFLILNTTDTNNGTLKFSVNELAAPIIGVLSYFGFSCLNFELISGKNIFKYFDFFFKKIDL